MSKINEWRASLNDVEGLELSDNMVGKLMELDGLDIEFDHLSDENKSLNESLVEKDEEIAKLKDTVWKLFENQTGISNQKPEEVENQKPQAKKPSDIIKFM
jgi:hypothetical protein